MSFKLEISSAEQTTQIENYAKNTANIIGGLFGKKPDEITLSHTNGVLELTNEYTASIFFVGSIFGEFLLSTNHASAVEIFGSQKDSKLPLAAEELGDTICEMLNMAAGSSLKNLLQQFEKVTITSPKLLNGKISYPGIKANTAILRYGSATIQLALYIDTMRLDIAESYKDNLNKLRDMNQSLLDANEKLKLQQMQLVHSEKMASLGTMAAGVAHEINNPLAYVLSNTDVLSTYVNAFHKLFDSYHRLAQDLSDRKAKETIADLRQVQILEKENDVQFILQDTLNLIQESKTGLDRIRAIVSGLKQFSRVDDSGFKFIQINDEIKNTLQLLNHEIKYRAAIELNLAQIPEVRCSPGELGQVFMNIILNAAQALPNSGGTISVLTEDAGDFAQIKISDNGCGISEENLKKIFNPFFTTKPVGKGTGLGLSISHEIIQKHEGRIEVISKVGSGTTFIIRLPYLGPKK